MKQWGGRFSKKTNKLVEKFTSSLAFDKRLWAYDTKGSIAHVLMLAKCKIISLDEADKIVDGLQAVYKDIEMGKVKLGQAKDEDIHSLVERLLTKKIGKLAGKLHTARSRNDQIALDMRMYTKDEIIATGQLILDFQKSLVELVKDNQDVIMPGFTHLQHGQPVLLAHHLLAYFWMLERDFSRLAEYFERVDVMPLGAGAFAGTNYPANPKFVTDELGFSKVAANSMDAVSDRDFVVEFLAALSLIMVHLSRFSEELILWSTPEFSFVELDEAYATGSSIMPQKKNPDVCELVRAKSGRVFGHLTAMLTVLKGLPLTYNRDLQEDKEGLFDAVDTVKACLEMLAGVVSSLKINEDKMKQAAEAGFATATDVADYLAKKGMPFREAHEVVGKIVKYCEKKNCTLTDLTLDDYKKFSSKFKKDVLEVVKVEQSVAAKLSPGSTSPASVKKQLALAEKALLKQEKRLAKQA